jgi:hypothetical protein
VSQKKAHKIASYEKDGIFLVVEDAMYVRKVRFFANTVDNSTPVYFFLDDNVALSLAIDMVNTKESLRHFEARGKSKEGLPLYREMGIVVDNSGTVFVISNFDGLIADDGEIVRSEDDDGDVISIRIPPGLSKDIGAAILLCIMKGT